MTSFPCTVQPCGYIGQTEKARADHVRKKHPMDLRPLPAPPVYSPILGAKRCVFYLRVSTIDQHPENQLPAATTFAALRGFETVKECGENGAYIDHGISGKHLDRPALKKLVADANSGLFDAVIFRRMSRLGRSLRDNVVLFDHFQSLGIALISVEEPVDTTTASGRFVRNVLASAAEYQREELLEQQREGIERRRTEGRYLGRHPYLCGIPKQLGGLGPCPDGAEHHPHLSAAMMNEISAETIARRKADAERKARSRARGRDRGAQKANAAARARGSVTRSPEKPGHLTGRDTALAEGA